MVYCMHSPLVEGEFDVREKDTRQQSPFLREDCRFDCTSHHLKTYLMQVEKWDREEIVKFWQNWYFPANATLYLVGDFDRSVEDCKALIERSFGSVPSS